MRKTCSIAGSELTLGGREARHLGVGGVREEEVDALFAQARETAQVGDPLVERELVHLEVAGVQDHAGPGADRDGEAVGDGVVDRQELEVERAVRRGVAVAFLDLAGHGADPVLLELLDDQGQRQPGGDHRDVRALAQEVRHAADVVLVPVGEHDADDVVDPVPDVAEVGQDHVDAGLVLLGEEDAAVDHEQLAVVLEDGHVATDLSQAAEGDDAEPACCQLRRVLEIKVGVAHEVPFWAVAGDLPPVVAVGATDRAWDQCAAGARASTPRRAWRRRGGVEPCGCSPSVTR